MPDFKSQTARIQSNDDATSGRQYNGGGEFPLTPAEARQQIEQKEKKIAPARIVESRCHVCQHPFRDWIELMLVKGMAHKTLAERVTPPVDRRSIGNHWKKHMDLQDAAFAHILEREAQLQGLDREEAIGDLVTKRGVLEIALRRGYQDILNGVTTVEPRDLIQITKLLADMDSHQQMVAVDELRAQVQIFIQAIKDTCDADVQNAIASRVKQLRSRENISQPMEKIMEEPSPKAIAAAELAKPDTDWQRYEEAVEAEIVEESEV